MWISASGLIARAAFQGDNGGTDRLGITSPTIVANQWYHATMVIDQSQGKLIGYLDGLGSGTTTATTAVALANGWVNQGGGGQTNTFTPTKNFTASGINLQLGRRNAAGAPFSGSMDDFVIWNEAISPTRVRSISSIATNASLGYNAGAAQGLWNVADAGGTVTFGNRTWSRVANGSLSGTPGVATAIAGNPGQFSLALDTSGNGVTSTTVGYVEAVVVKTPTAYVRLGEATGGFYSATSTHVGTAVGTVTRGASGPDGSSSPIRFAGFEAGNRGVSVVNTPGAVTAQNYIRVPHTTSLNPGTGDFTIEAWLRLDQNQAGTATALGKMGGVRNGFALGIFNGNQISGSLRDADGAFADADFSTQSAALSLNQWHHVVAVFDRNAPGVLDQAYLYVDGQLIGVTTSAVLKSGNTVGGATQSIGGTDDFLLGALSTASGTGFAFTGLLDEVAIYNYALSAEQVFANYNAAAVPEPRSVAIWSLVGMAALLISLRPWRARANPKCASAEV
jgi:hypothetical protein